MRERRVNGRHAQGTREFHREIKIVRRAFGPARQIRGADTFFGFDRGTLLQAIRQINMEKNELPLAGADGIGREPYLLIARAAQVIVNVKNFPVKRGKRRDDAVFPAQVLPHLDVVLERARRFFHLAGCGARVPEIVPRATPVR